MLQRVQTLFLLFVALCMTFTLLFTSWLKLNEATKEKVVLNTLSMDYFRGNQLISSTPTFYLAIVAVASALIAFYSIARYRNRRLQMQLGALNSLLIAAVLGGTLYLASRGNELLREPQEGTYSFGIYLPMLALIFNLVANRFIRRDEKLVRSADRMR